MKAVILAGGVGSRLSEETIVRPKPMLEVARSWTPRDARSRYVLSTGTSLPFLDSSFDFVLCHLGERRVHFVAAMKRRGILVRDRNSDPGCAGCVRITVGTDEQQLEVATRDALEAFGPMRAAVA